MQQDTHKRHELKLNNFWTNVTRIDGHNGDNDISHTFIHIKLSLSS